MAFTLNNLFLFKEEESRGIKLRQAVETPVVAPVEVKPTKPAAAAATDDDDDGES